MTASSRTARNLLLPFSLGALGVVFGDIGTSPLYAMREVFHAAHDLPVTRENVLGVLSLIVWSLLLVISVKYLFLVLRADRHGEGGILVLTSLVTPLTFRRGGRRWLLILLGLFGTALLFGDGMITPAISVMSAVEGAAVITPRFTPYVLPIAAGILIALFLVQRRGSGAVGSVFGPIMALWFLTIAALGLAEVVREPGVLAAIDPRFAAALFRQDPWIAFVVLGSVFLVVTGGEALYADMGHFGRGPIRLVWFGLAMPALLLNYAGQAALLVNTPAAVDNPFFRLAPAWFLMPLVVLATIAAVIASQALISGVFSLTMQAVQLGYIPRLTIEHTSARAFGQVYVPSMNWVLLASCLALVFGFRSSSNLAAAYGVAVTITMLITTVLLAVVMRTRWRWHLLVVVPLVALFLMIDAAYVGANLMKIPRGGWFPLVAAVVVFTLMTTWRRGRGILAGRLRVGALSIERFVRSLATSSRPRVPGTAVVMHRIPGTVPPALLASLRHFHALHEQVVMLTVETMEVPRVLGAERVTVESFGDGFFQVTLRFGFMELVDVPKVLQSLVHPDLLIDPATTTYILGRETVLASRGPGMALWRERLFILLSRNAMNAASFFGLPPERVIEVGIQVEI